MTQHKFVVLAVRLFALWIFVFSLQVAGAILAVDRISAFTESPWPPIMNALLILLLGAFCWASANWLAKVILGPTPEATPVQVSAHALFRAGTALLGLWLLTQAIPSFARIIFALVADLSPSGEGVSRSLAPAVGYCFGQFGVAIFLLTRGLGLANLALGVAKKTT